MAPETAKTVKPRSWWLADDLPGTISMAIGLIKCVTLVPLVLALLGSTTIKQGPPAPIDICCIPFAIVGYLDLMAGWLDLFPALAAIALGVFGLRWAKRHQGRVSYRSVVGIGLGIGILSWVIYWLVAIAPDLAYAL